MMGSNLFIPSNEPFQQGVQGIQNALVTRSRLDTAGLQNKQLGMENQQMARSMQKRVELESLIASSQNPDRDAFDWAKRNDQQLYTTLAKQHLDKFKETVRLNPQQAATQFEQATGEKITLGERFTKFDAEDGTSFYVDNLNPSRPPFVPKTAKEIADIRNDVQTDAATGQKLQWNPETKRYDIKVGGPAPEKTDISVTPFEEWRRQNPGKPVGEYFKLSQQSRPMFGMPQFVGIQDGQAAVYQPQRGGAGSMATIPLPGQGTIQPRTEPADVRAKRMGFAMAEPSLNAIAELSERINVNQGLMAKAVGAVERAKAQANLNDDVAEYESVVSGFTPMVARSVGHVGVLTEQDVQSVRKLFPAPGDSKSLRDRKIARLKSIIAGTEEAVGNIGSSGSAVPQGKKAKLRFDPNTGQLVPVN